MLRFLSENLRWLATGFLLAFGSSFGQTYFISLFAGEIRGAHELTDGDWGLLYTGATLCSALLLLGKGGWADTVPLSRLAPAVAAVFAGAALLMALGTQVWMLVLAVFLLRFCGQGMFTHIKVTAMARWFVATRGRAMAVTNLGYPLGEALLPVPVLLLAGLIGWRMTWGLTAGMIALIVLPLLLWLLSQDRAPVGRAAGSGSPGLGGRHWRRAEVLRHWVFWALVPFFLTPGFIGTVLFFHQAHVAEVKGWSLTAMATGYSAYAATVIATSFAAGWVADRFGPAVLLPVVVLPMAASMACLGPATQVIDWIIVLSLTGITQGMVGALVGTLLPAVYGTDNLGSVRAVVTALMVLSTAIGPGITGVFIDLGVTFPEQGGAMAAWCVLLSLGLIPVMRHLRRVV
jgi:sugar phosphate permease